ncbi:Lar family restriction alleviation protein [Neorhizobium alkalisoli]|uniref:Restriction alleviation protein Lar n=1 Tax=Neorhizobium alkalisoli TaxID=528178 RepID=A0A561QS70_9HYPH|nr:Lar family restriction alleviation protein [Neorhizobium alkalisoli]TWF53230.1 restriction alleviation protein Lar [Neorhizobium alkalisoli]
MTDKLLPCPFCDGEGYIEGREGEGFYVSCRDCYVCIGEAYDKSAMPEHMFRSEADAAAAWNRRAAPPETQRHKDKAAGHAMGWRHAVDAAVYRAGEAFSALISKEFCDPLDAHDKVIEALISLYSDRAGPPQLLQAAIAYHEAKAAEIWAISREGLTEDRKKEYGIAWCVHAGAAHDLRNLASAGLAEARSEEGS